MRIVATHPTFGERIFEVDKDAFIIGRDAPEKGVNVDVNLAFDRKVSRPHAHITLFAFSNFAL